MKSLRKERPKQLNVALMREPGPLCPGRWGKKETIVSSASGFGSSFKGVFTTFGFADRETSLRHQQDDRMKSLRKERPKQLNVALMREPGPLCPGRWGKKETIVSSASGFGSSFKGVFTTFGFADRETSLRHQQDD